MSVLHLTLFEPLPLPDEDRGGDPIVRVEATRHVVRLRRHIPDSPGGRRWVLELEIVVRVPDPEQTLADCAGFHVDEVDGREVGVVEDVEAAGPQRLVSALVVGSNWFGRRRVLVEADQIEVVIPAQRRLIVREPPSGFTGLDRHRA
jgi:sporulation protein YlmC with PRC-barrel domain